MDEVRMVRDGYPEPAPPTARAIARAKALLDEPSRRSTPRLRWGLTGALAAAAAATVAITLAGGNTVVGGNAPGGGSTVARPSSLNLDAKGAVLAAAEKAEQQPTGKYWYIDQIDGQSYIMRPKTGTYAITGAHSEMFSWWGAKSGMGEGHYGRDLPAHPLTAQDAALWRKDGSPSSFRVWSGDHYYTYTAKAQKWQMDGPERGTDPRGGGGGFVGAPGMSVEDLQNLPTDPAKLAERFLSDEALTKRMNPKGTREGGHEGMRLPPSVKISMAGALAMDPVPPKVRAGLMRALADQPGIHAIGRDTDPLERKGVALASDDRATTVTGEYGGPKAEQGTYRSRTVIVFDERTGAVLSVQEELTKPGGPYAEMKPGFVINYIAYRSAGWTDAKPKPSAELPFS
ncbi:CU044_5270 family protein [Planotetraspora thailandica]|nr:CU044_5270 family protein [Planotetraspora thailandica]